MANAPSLDAGDLAAVFRHVFSQLPDEAVVYPSENHYYFAFTGGGEKIRGNLWLDVGARDRGELAFSYAIYRNGEHYQGYTQTFQAPALILKRLEPFVYSATFESRTVRFRLHELTVRLPAGVRLRPGEVYIGPSFDDSGLQFALIYFKRYRHFHWILDEEQPVPEHFEPRGSDLVVGRRSKFVFFRDVAQNRLILVGVSAKEAAANSPFDGPFDHLPDNYIENGQVDLRSALSSYMDEPKTVDRFGRSLDAPSIRIAIQPYMLYEKLQDLSWVSDCKKRYNPNSLLFYACLANSDQ